MKRRTMRNSCALVLRVGIAVARLGFENRSKRGVVARRGQGNRPTVAFGQRRGGHLE